MKGVMQIFAVLLICLSAICFSCDSGTENQVDSSDTVTDAAVNVEGAEENAYNLPGADTGAIHENTSQPGVLDMDAREGQ